MNDVRHIKANQLELAFLDVGAGPPVLLFHGFPDLATTFVPLAQRLDRRGFRAIAPWLRGYWPSDAAGFYDIESLVSDAIGLAEALQLESVHVVGHDWGADIAYGLSAARPDLVASTVALAVPHSRALGPNRALSFEQLRLSFYIWLFQLEGLAEQVVASNDFAFLRRLWQDWSPGWDPPEDHLSAVLGTFARPGVLGAALGYYRAAFGAGDADPAHADMRDELQRRIGVPTLLLLGARDRCILAEMAAGAEEAFGQHYRAEIISDCGHFLQLERPDVVAERVIAWFDRFPVQERRG